MSTTAGPSALRRASVGQRRSAGRQPQRPASRANTPAFERGSFGALLQPQAWSALELMGRAVAFPRGAALMHEGEPGDRVMVLLTGRAKIALPRQDGQDLIVGIRGPGDLLGELPLIDGQPRLGSVIALEPVHALVIDARAFRRYLAITPPLMLTLMEVLSRRLRDALHERAEYAVSDTISRVAARLIDLAERYGEPCQQGILIGLPLSQEELGGWVGASHAGTARALQGLRELRWILTDRRRIIVRNAEALRRRSGQAQCGVSQPTTRWFGVQK